MNREYVNPASTRVLLALVRVHARTGRATVREVAAEAGRSIARTHLHLERLKETGLVAWEVEQDGTLRPLVAVVPFQATPHHRVRRPRVLRGAPR